MNKTRISIAVLNYATGDVNIHNNVEIECDYTRELRNEEVERHLHCALGYNTSEISFMWRYEELEVSYVD